MAAADSAQFSLANLPLGIATTTNKAISQHQNVPGIVTRLHDYVYFLSAMQQNGLFGHDTLTSEIKDAIQQRTLNGLASLGRRAHRQVRNAMQSILRATTEEPSSISPQLAACRVPISDVIMHLPVTIGDFSDFSCSVDHALNAGEAVVGIRKLPPGFLHFPIGYGGRSSSIMVSGGDVLRPWGHFKQGSTVAEVVFAPSRAVDFELEVACVVGKPSEPGRLVPASEAAEHIFGFVLLNDWSARDIQTLEMPPLGPFLGKSFATTISPWIILADALEPFLVPVPTRQIPVADHFTPSGEKGHYAVTLAVDVGAAPPQGNGGSEGTSQDNRNSSLTRACTSQLDSIYWTIADMLAHQTSNGCAIRTGDLLATGTVSGSERGSFGCLLEITKGGKEPFVLGEGKIGGEKAERMYLEDGDTVVMSGWAGDIGSDSCVGFGECRGTLRAARSLDR
ncbi:Fumarylacetoacetase [Cyphellophora attinorum]|uniref:Fumarylacetoacetase n=1 Tax=Cyphellophora attinorum TaxID=1664694 RepID=A0A0N1HH77_9EURO|nr:Fumarylacetoacetase [Phialophora attinorum]KPI35043.1 Fumarylacetoacetase [Phialophora attinorum]